MFWVISVYFNVRNILPQSGTFPRDTLYVLLIKNMIVQSVLSNWEGTTLYSLTSSGDVVRPGWIQVKTFGVKTLGLVRDQRKGILLEKQKRNLTAAFCKSYQKLCAL